MNVLILRDPKESPAKCSLTPLRALDRIRFVEYHPDRRLDATGHVLLHPDGDELTAADAGHDLFVIDCAWRRVEKLLRTVDGDPVRRRLPLLTTAYPRRSRVFADPGSGLASVEALFAASVILDAPWPGLLDHYRWREEFLRGNPTLQRA